MAKKPQTAAAAIAETLSELQMHEQIAINGYTVLRVPGGFIYSRGSASQFVPLNELSAGEAGIELVNA